MKRNNGEGTIRRVNVAKQRAQPTEQYNNRIGIVVSLDACPRKVVRERMERGSNAVMSCPTTERNRSRVSRCVKYPSRTSLYKSSNGSCLSRSVVSFKRWFMHFFLLNPKHSGGSRMNLPATAAH